MLSNYVHFIVAFDILYQPIYCMCLFNLVGLFVWWCL